MPIDILNIHTEEKAIDLRQETIEGLSNAPGQKTLPTMLLYDQRGLRLYDDITTQAPEYYLFGAEEQILKNHGSDIVRSMHRGVGGIVNDEVVLELGSGALRKTSHILKGLASLVPEDPAVDHPPITYYALDLEEQELKRTLGQIESSEIGQTLHGKVRTKGMWGTYDDGMKFVQEGGLVPPEDTRVSRSPTASVPTGLRDTSPISDISASSGSDSAFDTPPSTAESASSPPLHLLFLGSSLGNFDRPSQAAFLRSLPLRPGSGDTLLLGMDHDNSKEDIEAAYNDPAGYTTKFIMNGLKAAGRSLGDDNLFTEEKWEYVNSYNVEERRHEAFFKCKRNHTVQTITGKNEMNFSFLENEMVKVEQSVKFSESDMFSLFTESNLIPMQRWTDSEGRYSLWLLERPSFIFPLLKSPLACNHDGSLVQKNKLFVSPFGVPAPEDWENLWTAWDFITMKMIPPSMLHQRPIDLRHICLFYLGHIPAFLDIHLSRLLQQPHTEPEYFKNIFERGIDPNVDDPTQCHDHSLVPTSEEDWPTLTTIVQFQSRVRQRLLRLYDELISGKRTLTRKEGRVLFMTFEHEAMHLETLLYMLLQRAGAGTLPPPGFSPPDWASLTEIWNIEPTLSTSSVTLGPATITIGHDDIEAEDDRSQEDAAQYEYGWDNESPTRQISVNAFRIDWRPVTNGQFYDFFSNKDGKGLQLPASWVEEDGEVRVRTFFGSVSMKTAYNWPVMTSYDNLSAYAVVKGGRIPSEAELRVFYERFEAGYEGGANIGFRHWHPVPATTGGERNGGKGTNGGVWEWTSTTFDRYEGFTPSKLYPGYSVDFFDGAHNVVLGGSFATIPRLAERRSLRNWYQKNYPYAWIGGRVAYDIKN